MSPHIKEQLETLRRITNRGLKTSLVKYDSEMTDIWQHMEDEVERLKLFLEDK